MASEGVSTALHRPAGCKETYVATDETECVVSEHSDERRHLVLGCSTLQPGHQ